MTINKIDAGSEALSLETATDLFDRLRELNSNKQEIKNVAEKKIQELQIWEEQQTVEIREEIGLIEAKLKEFYLEQRETNPKFKLETAFGSIKSRKQKSFKYDADKMLQYAKENHLTEIVRVKEEIDKNLVKKMFGDGINHETGEIIDFIEIDEEQKVRFELI